MGEIEYTQTFNKDSNIWKLYLELKKAGVKDEDLDRGYSETDYTNKKQLPRGEKDQIIQAEEVLDYALERYERFHLALKEQMGYVIPWTLDDFDPATTFDQEIRDKLQAKIKFIKDEMKKAGYLDTKTDEYKELLAVSVFTYVVAGKKDETGVKVFVDDIKELRRAKLGKIAEMILDEGGLGLADIKNDCDPEGTALEALKKKCGACTELSYVTHAALKMAGIETASLFVEAPPAYLIKKGWPPGTNHNSLVLELKNKKRIFDPGLKMANAEPEYRKESFTWVQETHREWLGFYYSLYATNVKAKVDEPTLLELYKKAKELNGNYYLTNLCLGVMHYNQGEIKLAIESFKKALALKPGAADGMEMLAKAYVTNHQEDEAVMVYKKHLTAEPSDQEALRAIVQLCYNLQRYDDALEFARKSVALNPNYLAMRNVIGQIYGKKEEFDRAEQEFKKLLKDNPDFLPAYKSRAAALFDHGKKMISDQKPKEANAKLDEAKAVLQAYLKRKPEDKKALNLLQQIEAAQKELEKPPSD